ncbi:MAG TPA: hypothetical protein VJQ60_05510 [Arthrobacter sp.]|nr:hypothetical protein [Arthrobacter sp.]
MKTRASFRLFRTGLIGAVVLGLSAGGHLAAGGRLPEPAVLAALCALTMVPVAVLTRFRLSFPVLLALLGAGQAWLHWSFDAFSTMSMPSSATMAAASVHGGHTSASLIAGSLEAVFPTHGVDDGGLMLAAHAAATLGTALVLARGERALWAVAHWLRPLVQLPEPCRLGPVQRRAVFLASYIIPASRLGLQLPSRRGPPAMIAAA